MPGRRAQCRADAFARSREGKRPRTVARANTGDTDCDIGNSSVRRCWIRFAVLAKLGLGRCRRCALVAARTFIRVAGLERHLFALGACTMAGVTLVCRNRLVDCRAVADYIDRRQSGLQLDVVERTVRDVIRDS